MSERSLIDTAVRQKYLQQVFLPYGIFFEKISNFAVRHI